MEVRGEGQQENGQRKVWKNQVNRPYRDPEIQMVQKKGNKPKTRINFLKNQFLARNTFFPDEIAFLCRKLREALAKKVDTSAYLSSNPVAVNADEPHANEDLAKLKPEESAIRSDNKKKNTKEISNTVTKVNSNANDNVER